MIMKRLRQYLSKMFLLVPLTFLFTPLFYTLLGYHREIPFFPALVYFWYALFIFIGIIFAGIFKKYKYLAYLAILVFAFLCKDMASLLNLQKTVVVYTVPEGKVAIDKNEKSASDVSDNARYEVFIELTENEKEYYKFIVFLTSLIAGCFGAAYSKKTALELVSRGNTFLFLNVYIISTAYYFISGIMGVDKDAAGMFVIYLTAFAISYFIVRNFGLLSREIEVYGEKGAYSVSGIRRIYGYYFALIALTAIVPVIIGTAVIPFIIKAVTYLIEFIFAHILGIPLLFPDDEPPVSDEYIPDPFDKRLEEFKNPTSPDEYLIYYIVVAIALIWLFIFRKHIFALIKDLILKLKEKTKLFSFEKNEVINQEIITEAEKPKNAKFSRKDYLKRLKKITGLREKCLFAYNYIFWHIVKNDEDLKESATPNEVAEKYAETKNLAKLYQNLKYGMIDETDDRLMQMLNEADNFLVKDETARR